MKKVLNYLSHLFGFEKLSEYERNYLHDKNIQGSLYIGYLTIALEIWMLIRQSVTKIIPKYQNGGSLFEPWRTTGMTRGRCSSRAVVPATWVMANTTWARPSVMPKIKACT